MNVLDTIKSRIDITGDGRISHIGHSTIRFIDDDRVIANIEEDSAERQEDLVFTEEIDRMDTQGLFEDIDHEFR